MLERRLAKLKKTIAARGPGLFHFADLYGPGWEALYVGDKVRLGREFLGLVRKGCFPGVEDTGRKQTGGRVYLKHSAH